MRVEADFLHTDQHQSYTAINCLQFSLILKPRDTENEVFLSILIIQNTDQHQSYM